MIFFISEFSSSTTGAGKSTQEPAHARKSLNWPLLIEILGLGDIFDHISVPLYNKSGKNQPTCDGQCWGGWGKRIMGSRSAWYIQWDPFTNKYKASKNQTTFLELPVHLDSFIPCIPMYSGSPLFFLRRHIYDHILFSLSFEGEKGHLSHLSVYWGKDTVWGRGSGVRFAPPCFASGAEEPDW